MIFFKSLPSTVTVWQNFENPALVYMESRWRIHELAPARLGAFSALARWWRGTCRIGSRVEVGRCGCYSKGKQNQRRNDMAHNKYDGEPPRDRAQYSVRGGNYGRLAICFHCRCAIRLDRYGSGEFQEHLDVDRTKATRGRFGRGATIKIQGIDQLCPGSNTTPIPLAYKFPDGEPLPYH